MSKINIKFPDETEIIFPGVVTAGEAFSAWRVDLLPLMAAARINGEPVDLSHFISADANVAPILYSAPEGLEVLRHSVAHVMAQAVQDLFPGVQVAIGPAIEDGFYYDFDFSEAFVPADLEKIEGRMREIIKADIPFERRGISRVDAVEVFKTRAESYKVELLNDLHQDIKQVSVYSQGNYVDLCRGPHVPSTGAIRAFKLTNLAGAYWRGDEKNRMLQRIYGVAFLDEAALTEHLRIIEEAKKRDHRRLGKELDLFQISDEAGPGLAIFHPKGAMLRHIIEDWEKKEHLKRGYDLVMGPQLLKSELWKKSGHYDHYKENMYFTEVENQSYGIKPMNCLSHMLIYKNKIRSYRDLPLRYFELGTVHRHEKTGVLHGLVRVRQFTQDDAHILCTPQQLNSEIKAITEFISYAMKIFGFSYEVELSTRPERSIGSDEAWEMATTALEATLRESGIPYQLNEGDGAFYGPKIDFKLSDALKRKWQCATIQCDFTLPERFDLTYIGADGEKHRPVMLHRVILGAIERFMGILIEHYAGAFPVWLSPVQAVLLTVTDERIPYGERVYQRLLEAGIRVERDFRNEKLSYKIREAQLQKIPYMLVIGEREVDNETISPRERNGQNLGALAIEDFISLVKEKDRLYQ
ncbi:MAG: threonine--tRNA ligase [Smithellaceae bacterium]|nr:threonine--tRNA ligase [Smithellaceae bacterium]